MESTSDFKCVPADRGAAPLVKIAEFSGKNREVIDPKTGEIQRFTLDKRRREFVLDNEPTDARFNRFALQGAARKLFPSHRVSKCLRNVQNVNGDVAILKSQTNAKCHYGGLQTCGAIWLCPICAAKISERRKLEVRSALDTHLAAGGGLEMVTLTFPHSRTDVLKLLMRQLRQAMILLKKTRDYSNARSIYKSIGSIRALEVTWSDVNGWHPHFHEIWFFAKPLTVMQRRLFTSMLYAAWSSSCVKAGLPKPNRQRGVHVQPAESAAEYIAKFGTEPRWEAASELTKQHVKKSRDSKGRTPFDLLRDYAQGNSRAGALFAEFVDAFFRFQQLRWTNGLKAIFGVDELSDEEIAAAKEDKAIEISKIPVDEWKRVLRMSFDARATLLTLAENGGHAAVRVFLDGLPFIVSSSLTPDYIPPQSKNLLPKKQLKLF